LAHTAYVCKSAVAAFSVGIFRAGEMSNQQIPLLTSFSTQHLSVMIKDLLRRLSVKSTELEAGMASPSLGLLSVALSLRSSSSL
jgi:hypothetical protein